MAETTKKTETPAEEQKLMTPADMKKMVEDHQIPMSESSLAEMSKDMTPEKGKAFEEYVRNTAMGLYPTMATQIKAGIPVKHLIEPYRQVAKQMLGDQAELDFAGDPKASAALTGGFDPATQRPAPMSLNQWKAHIQSHPGFNWEQTPNGRDWSAGVAQSIRQMFTSGEANGK